MEHKEWLNNEYKLWVEALQESTVHNFKEHKTVRRMLGEVDPDIYLDLVINREGYDIFSVIDNIGFTKKFEGITGACVRMVNYALKILELNPKSICEIGGGVGQFYAILRAMGYEGSYYIHDLPEVNEFQVKYLREVEHKTGLKLPLTWQSPYELCVSFYALGEFDDELKQWYINNIVNRCPHGFIIWNAHSGASKEINIKHKLLIQPEQPLTLPGNLQVTW